MVNPPKNEQQEQIRLRLDFLLLFAIIFSITAPIMYFLPDNTPPKPPDESNVDWVEKLSTAKRIKILKNNDDDSKIK